MAWLLSLVMGLAVLLGPYCAQAQDSLQTTGASPYRVSWKKDIGITAGAVGITVLGVYIKRQKPPLGQDELQRLSAGDVNRLDRFTAGNYDPHANKLSQIPFFTAFGLPLLLLFDDAAYQSAPQVYLLYAEAISVAGAVYALTSGLVDRNRPFLYSDKAPLSVRTENYARDSFYGGHVPATAAATFFTAKVLHDLHPEARWEALTWTGAVALPAAVAYLRMKAGNHFLTDNLVGITVGGGIGWLVPHLHRKDRDNRLTLLPLPGPQQGVLLGFRF